MNMDSPDKQHTPPESESELDCDSQLAAATGSEDKSRAGMFKQWMPFEPGPVSVHERFPSLSGRQLQDHVWQTYLVADGLTVPYFTPSGKRALVRHPLNNRQERDTRRHYVQFTNFILPIVATNLLQLLKYVSCSVACLAQLRKGIVLISNFGQVKYASNDVRALSK